MARGEKWSHLSIGQRKTIAHLIAVGKKVKEIGEAFGVDPPSR